MISSSLSREQIIENNLGLVHSCANRFRGRGMEYDDLYQAGCVGLIKAVDGFDESRGFAFSTYAVPVILGEIKRLFRDGGAIKIGRSLKEKAMHAQRQRERFITETGREPTVSEMAQKLGLDVAETAQVLTACQAPLSLTIEGEEGERQIDIAVEPPENDLSDLLSLHEVIAKLPEKERSLIYFRYFKGYTQARTAAELGVSQVQISRKEKMILQKLHKSLDE